MIVYPKKICLSTFQLYVYSCSPWKKNTHKVLWIGKKSWLWGGEELNTFLKTAKEYLLLPILVICSYSSYSNLKLLVTNITPFLLQLFCAFIIICLCFCLSKIKNRILPIILCVLATGCANFSIAIVSHSFDNIKTLFTVHPPLYKAIVVWGCRILGIPFMHFQFLSLFIIIIALLYSSQNSKDNIDGYSKLLILCGCASFIFSGLMGLLAKENNFIYSCITSLLSIRFYNRFSFSKDDKWHYIIPIYFTVSALYFFINQIYISVFF